LLDGDTCVSKDSPKSPEGHLSMQWNGYRNAPRVGSMPHPDVAAFLPDHRVAKFPECADQFLA
jgi:hypothetical protein